MAQKCMSKNTLISRNWHEYFGKICFAILNCYTKLIILYTYYQFSILLWKIYSVRPFTKDCFHMIPERHLTHSLSELGFGVG